MVEQKDDRSRLLEAQWAIVGAMLVDPDIVGEVVAECRAEDFMNSTAKAIFNACKQLHFDNVPVDPVTVLHLLGDGYKSLVTEAMIVTPTAANWKSYAEILRSDAKIARVQELGQSLMATIDETDASNIMQKLSDVLCDKNDTRVVPFSQGYDEFYARHSTDKPPEYIKWGFSALNDRLTAELGDVIVIGARPSAGKTMLAGQMAIAMAQRHPNLRVGFFSFETQDRKLYDRLLCHLADLSLKDVKQNKLGLDSWQKIGDASSYRNLQLDIINAAGMTVSDIKAKTLSNRYSIIFIDYVQLVAAPWHKKRFDAVTEISLQLKQFAQSANVMIVELAQLARPERASKVNAEPRLSDLRESGQIEQDADIVMLLFPLDAEDHNSDRRLDIAKNKDGPLGRLMLGFDADHMTFVQQSSRQNSPKPAKRETHHQTTFQEIQNDTPVEVVFNADSRDNFSADNPNRG